MNKSPLFLFFFNIKMMFINKITFFQINIFVKFRGMFLQINVFIEFKCIPFRLIFV